MYAPPTMPHLTLCESVDEALAVIRPQFEQRTARLLSLQGLAGTGKTTAIKTLVEVLPEALGLPAVIGAPTHRAVQVLRSKGHKGAETTFKHAMKPIFKPEYQAALDWVEASTDLGCVPPLIFDAAVKMATDAHDSTQGELFGRGAGEAPTGGNPWPILQRLSMDARSQKYRSEKVLLSIGLCGADYFERFDPYDQQKALLIVDEASMVSRKHLDNCLHAFAQVLLVGDPGQLPPVEGQEVLTEVPGAMLIRIYRQAEGSMILELAHRVRGGFQFWRNPLDYFAPDVEEVRWVSARALIHSPLLVFENTKRRDLTLMIRKTLGYPDTVLQPGEPVVCRASSQKDQYEGWYNNMLCRIVAVDKENPRLLLVEDELEHETHECLVHMEEIDGPYVRPDAILFRFGYCYTVHTAQGSEWPLVHLHAPSFGDALRAYRHYQHPQDMPRLAYTAVTRAREKLVVLKTGVFRE